VNDEEEDERGEESDLPLEIHLYRMWRLYIQTGEDLNPPLRGLGFISLLVIDHEEYESAVRIKFLLGLNAQKNKNITKIYIYI
jgi:hypothetical protein